ncbi:hypothetical protein MLD38_026210 [Melastoma candidum]|uniref:Uncharacterized protein n=1 Tax=Melastoma candidum TaxID=119954 RepID=A0ACB9P306_9MYRT|nr:hypothetical protein MLD38_026210 [Melastoma candidum]
MNDVPGVSFQLALHLAQMKRAGKFMMYDYGSSSANMVACSLITRSSWTVISRVMMVDPGPKRLLSLMGMRSSRKELGNS